MTDFDKLTVSIEKLQSNSQYTLTCTILWQEGTAEISREDIKTEMDKL